MGFPHTVNLRGILYGFPQRNGRRTFHNAVAAFIQGLPNPDIQRGGVYINPVHVLHHESGEGKVHLFIVADGNLVRLQFTEAGQRLFVQIGRFILPDKPIRLFHGYQEVRDYQRIIVYVRSADVQQPGYLVQGGEHYSVHLLQDHPLPEPVNLGFPGLSHQVFPQGDDGGNGNGGPVLPKRGQNIRNGLNGGRWNCFLQCSHGLCGLAEPVDGYHWRLHAQGGYPFRNGDLLRNAHLMQLDAGSVQLPPGLDKIAGVRPQAGVIPGDYQVSRLSRET